MNVRSRCLHHLEVSRAEAHVVRRQRTKPPPKPGQALVIGATPRMRQALGLGALGLLDGRQGLQDGEGPVLSRRHYQHSPACSRLQEGHSDGFRVALTARVVGDDGEVAVLVVLNIPLGGRQPS